MVDESHLIMEQHGVHLLHEWATLGDYDFVSVIEAPDAKTAAQVSALIAATGNFRASTLSAVLFEDLGDGHRI